MWLSREKGSNEGKRSLQRGKSSREEHLGRVQKEYLEIRHLEQFSLERGSSREEALSGGVSRRILERHEARRCLGVVSLGDIKEIPSFGNNIAMTF